MTAYLEASKPGAAVKSPPYEGVITLWPEEVKHFNMWLDREGIPAGTLKQRVKMLLDSHWRLRRQVKDHE